MPPESIGEGPDRALVAAVPLPAVLTSGTWDKDGATIAFANREFCALTGYAAGELVGRNTRILHGPRTDVRLLRQRQEILGDARSGSGEGWLYRQAGGEFYAEWKYRALREDDPASPLLMVYQDRSEFRRLREALLHAQKLGAVGLLTSGVAHDFNNLLSVINGYCEIMAPKVADVPAAQKDLTEIHRAGLKASAIARQILEFSRQRETEAGVVNFNTLVREIADIIRRVCGDEINVELRLASDLGNARINPVQFQQVLLNLCFNARDAMVEAGGDLTLRTYNRPAEAGARAEVVLEVTDTGRGIPPALQEKIFEPFYTTKAHGTGLGLSTSQGLIHQAGGRLAVQSSPLDGTTFQVLLPETAEPVTTGVTELGTLPATRGSETVLVIESDAGLRKMISGVLTVDGYTVREAATAEEVAPDLRPHLAIANTSAADGVIALRALVAAQPGLRVISTAAEAPDLPVFETDAGWHLSKPFALSSLLTKVRELLDTPVAGDGG